MHNNRVCISVTGTTWHDQWARNLQTPAVSNSCQASWLFSWLLILLVPLPDLKNQNCAVSYVCRRKIKDAGVFL